MIANNFKHPQFRKKVTHTILEMLACLPETQRNIFIWNHYRRRSVEQIAEMLAWISAEAEATLDRINSLLAQRTRSLIKEDPRLDAGIDLMGNATTRRTFAYAECDPAAPALTLGFRGTAKPSHRSPR